MKLANYKEVTSGNVPLCGCVNGVNRCYVGDCLVDEKDLENVKKYKWFLQNGYPATKIDGKIVKMHRYLLGITNPKVEIDHINHNILDNRRSNLRVCTHAQNLKNRKGDCKGISLKPNGKYQVKVGDKHVGMADTINQAKCMYNAYAQLYFGEFASPVKI